MKLNLITSPDKLLNRNTSYLLVCPSDRVRQDFNSVAKDFTTDVNLYWFDETEENNNVQWLIEVANIVDHIVVDVDNVHDNEWIVGYLLGFGKTYYLTSNNDRVYNNINMNRIYDLSWITEKGDQIEKKG